MEMFTRAQSESPSSLGMALVISSTTPLILLDDALCIKAVSDSFCRAFSLDCGTVIGASMFAIGDGEWNIPQLRSLLEATAAGRAAIESYEMDLTRSGKDTRNLVLSAHILELPEGVRIRIALAVSDITESRKAERAKDDLVREKQLLLLELQHRVANSLQIIASVLMQSVRRVQSEETRTHLRDAHQRVMSIATLQRQLAQSESDEVAVGPYFKDLCSSISASMIGDPLAVRIVVTADATVTNSSDSVSLGLIVTELVINCLKHAFTEKTTDGLIEVDYRHEPTGWTLSVQDNGIGLADDHDASQGGLGTGIVSALARQLKAVVSMTDTGNGTRVAIVQQKSDT